MEVLSKRRPREKTLTMVFMQGMDLLVAGGTDRFMSIFERKDHSYALT